MDLISLLLAWIDDHPTWAGLLVASIAFAESLALVGLFLPGAAMMFGVGALVGAGTLELLPTLVWAAGGAIAGDGVSFWLGRHLHGRLRAVWPFTTHPQLIENATDFFQRHGGKSVLLGRFVGPIRPIIPAVAGMMDMPTGRFLAVNVVSGVFWAPVYVIPGMVFAATLGLAAEVAMRLAVIGGLLLALLVLVGWLVKRVFDWIHPHAHTLIARALAWSANHPRAGELPAAILDPDHPAAKGLTLWALLLLVAAATFVTILQTADSAGLLFNLNEYVYHTLADLRTPVMDRIMVAVTQLADGGVLTALFVAVLVLLLVRRHWTAAGYWVAAGAFALVATHLLKAATALARPGDTFYTGVLTYAFPSGHTTHSAIVVGFLAVMIAREVKTPHRWATYAVAAVFVTAIAFSRLYLGVHWLTDVLGGLSLALAWVALLGIAYRRHPIGRVAPGPLTIAALLALGVAGSWNIEANFREDLARYAPVQEVRDAELTAWWGSDWRRHDTYRSELREVRRHPLTLQYAGELAPLREALLAAGWEAPPDLNGLSWLRWLNASASLQEVPVLPQVHDGHHQSLLLVRPLPEDNAGPRLAALRLWPAGWRLQPGDAPLWIGNATTLRRSDISGLTVPRTGTDFDTPLALLHAGLEMRFVVDLRSRAEKQPGWDGSVLLVRKEVGPRKEASDSSRLTLPPTP